MAFYFGDFLLYLLGIHIANTNVLLEWFADFVDTKRLEKIDIQSCYSKYNCYIEKRVVKKLTKIHVKK